jgi:hypothetical protein
MMSGKANQELTAPNSQIAVSNICMTTTNRWFVKTSLFLLFSSSVLASGTLGQAPTMPVSPPGLVFEAIPAKQLVTRGEAVVLDLYIRNRSAGPIFVSRLKGDEFVDFSIIGPDHEEVPWRGKGRIDSKEYSPSDFAVLKRYEEITAKRIISLKDGAGFVFDKPGQYSVTAEYSLGPPEYFGPFAGETKIPTGSFRSTKAAFCIEACILEPLRVHSNASQAALDAVRVFYTYITGYRPLGIPQGRAKKVLWSLLSKRLEQELDSFQACENDYYQRHGDILRANHYKPETPWLEEGLFSGPNEAAGPMKFTILSSEAIGENRVDVHLRFTLKQTNSYDYEGVVTVIQESNRWVIDDFVSMYENDELIRLSDGYPECKGGQWVGETPY